MVKVGRALTRALIFHRPKQPSSREITAVVATATAAVVAACVRRFHPRSLALVRRPDQLHTLCPPSSRQKMSSPLPRAGLNASSLFDFPSVHLSLSLSLSLHLSVIRHLSTTLYIPPKRPTLSILVIIY